VPGFLVLRREVVVLVLLGSYTAFYYFPSSVVVVSTFSLPRQLQNMAKFNQQEHYVLFELSKLFKSR